MSAQKKARYGVLKVIEAREHYLQVINGGSVWTRDRQSATGAMEFAEALIFARSRGGLVVELDECRPGEEQTLFPI